MAYSGIQSRARNADRVNDVKQLQKILELYRTDNGAYPPTPSGYNASLLPLSAYINKIPSDPDYPYLYYNPGVPDTYGIRMYLEGTGYCVTGMNPNPGWWGAGQLCPS